MAVDLVFTEEVALSLGLFSSWLLGDPVADLHVAPALQYHAEVWTAINAMPGPHLRLPLLRQTWERARPLEVFILTCFFGCSVFCGFVLFIIFKHSNSKY